MTSGNPAFDEDDIELDPEMLEAIARAEAAVAEMAGDYDLQLAADVAMLDELTVQMEEGDLNGPCVRSAFDTAHNVKGQGGSFGYDLVSDVANGLCDFLRERSSIPAAHVPVVRAHVDALMHISQNAISGDGGEDGAAMCQALERQVADVKSA